MTAADLPAVLAPEASAQALQAGGGGGAPVAAAGPVMLLRPDVHVAGVDVLVRGQTWIDVQASDGHRLPFADRSFDAVMFVDVLHHTQDPMELLAEAVRVAREAQRVGQLFALAADEAKSADGVIRLEETVIEGRVQKPNAFFINTRQALVYKDMPLDESFVGEVVKASEKAPF